MVKRMALGLFVSCSVFAQEIDFTEAPKLALSCKLKVAMDEYAEKEFPKKLDFFFPPLISPAEASVRGKVIFYFKGFDDPGWKDGRIFEVTATRDSKGWRQITGDEPLRITFNELREPVLAYNYGRGLYSCVQEQPRTCCH